MGWILIVSQFGIVYTIAPKVIPNDIVLHVVTVIVCSVDVAIVI